MYLERIKFVCEVVTKLWVFKHSPLVLKIAPTTTLMMKRTFSQPYIYVGRESLTIKYVSVSASSFQLRLFVRTYATRNATDS